MAMPDISGYRQVLIAVRVVRTLPRAVTRLLWMATALAMIGAGLEMATVALVPLVLSSLSGFAASAPSVKAGMLPASVEDWFAGLGTGVMIVFLAIFMVKTMTFTAVSWLQARLSARAESAACAGIMDGFIENPDPMIAVRSSEFVRDLTSGASLYGHGVLLVSSLMVDVIVSAALVAIVIWIDPLGAIAAAVVLGIAAFAYRVMLQPFMRLWGAKRHALESERLRQASEAFRGVREIRLYGASQSVSRDFSRLVSGLRDAQARFIFVSQLPRIWLEFVAIAAVGTVVLVGQIQRGPGGIMVGTLAAFSAAALRLAPTLSKVLAYSGSLDYYRNSIAAVCDRLEDCAASGSSARQQCLPIRFGRTLALDRVTFVYRNAQTPILRNASIEIPRGSMVGIIGTSGSGKSTILDLLLGFAQPSSGSVSLDGQFCRLSVHGWEGEVGYVPQSIFLTDDSVRRNVALGVPDGEIDDQAVILALSRARLLDWVQSLPRGLDTLIGEGGSLISGGERQRLGVARALYRLPQVLFLDEATSALDAGTEAALMRDIESMAATMTIIVVSHRDRPLKACDLVYQVADGNVTLVRRHDSQANNSLELVPDT